MSQHRPRLLVVTPEFQNPTGVTLNMEQRRAIVGISQRFGVIVIESQIYRELRYRGQSLPSLKQLDESGNVISVGSYSKVAFPGLRVGWVIAPQPVVARLAQAKETSDLHSDQLSQAVLLRFAESGELARHVKRTREAGAARLQSVLESCEAHLPPGSRFTRPEGGMNLWVELPAPLVADELLKVAEERGVSFLPGSCFSVRRAERRGLRISFGGLAPESIARGISILGVIAREQLASQRARMSIRADGSAGVEGAFDLRYFLRSLNMNFGTDQFRLKVGLAEMLKGGVIMDVMNAEQAMIAEQAGATAVMALERVPCRYPQRGRRGAYVARSASSARLCIRFRFRSWPRRASATSPRRAFSKRSGVDYIDESEVLTPADEEHHIDKNDYKVPFVCGARNLGEALRRIAEGAAMIRTKGEAGSGNIVEAVRHIRTIVKEMKQLTVLGKEELVHEAKNLRAPLELVEWVAEHGKLPVPNFSAGGIATPADAALVMQLGAEAVFVGRDLQIRGSRIARPRHRQGRDLLSTIR